tara:strand:+ start:188 stop:289 length:102 start_codon:yes stop_codon:yes gene_type:complete
MNDTTTLKYSVLFAAGIGATIFVLGLAAFLFFN